uniref:Uncharacterized protein n=1 Tax=Molossus molossus TaxID=27622 RepID=A0A7J8BYK8_MOLMO|nr:hypothetical protein HJG59_010083 [Molossus molossus]
MASAISHTVSEFIPSGPPRRWERQVFLFSMFFVTYFLPLFGNMAMTWAVRWDHQLHTPMYILLADRSFLGICYVSPDVPNMLASSLSQAQTSPSLGGHSECLFLSIMAMTGPWAAPCSLTVRTEILQQPGHFLLGGPFPLVSGPVISLPSYPLVACM